MSQPRAKPLHVAIHDLNQHGGQDRSTLEILRRLLRQRELVIHAFSVVDPDLAGVTRFVRPNLRRPVLLKVLYYYFVLMVREILGGGGWRWHATGVSHLRSHVLHLQFIHRAWHARRTESEHRGFFRIVYHDLLERLNIAFEWLCFREGKTYICISRSVADDLRAHFGILQNVHVVHHGVDPARFRPISDTEKTSSPARAAAGVRAGELMLLFVGSYERKGLETCLRAFALLSPQLRARLRFCAVGDGDRDRFQRLATDLGVGDRIALLPKTPGIVPFFQAADLFVFPTQYEPFGLVILEAMACGVPVLVSRSAGGAELITDGQDGFLLDHPRDASALAARLELAVQDPAQLSRVGRAARRLAEARSWDVVAGEYEKVLQGLDRS